MKSIKHLVLIAFAIIVLAELVSSVERSKSNLKSKKANQFPSHGISQGSRLNRRGPTNPSMNPLPPAWTTGPQFVSNGGEMNKNRHGGHHPHRHVHSQHSYRGTSHRSWGRHHHASPHDVHAANHH